MEHLSGVERGGEDYPRLARMVAVMRRERWADRQPNLTSMDLSVWGTKDLGYGMVWVAEPGRRAAVNVHTLATIAGEGPAQLRFLADLRRPAEAGLNVIDMAGEYPDALATEAELMNDPLMDGLLEQPAGDDLVELERSTRALLYRLGSADADRDGFTADYLAARAGYDEACARLAALHTRLDSATATILQPVVR